MAIEKKLITIEEFEQFADSPENSERRFELIDGEIVEKMPTEIHGIIVAWIVVAFGMYIKGGGAGRVAVEVRHRKLGDKHNAFLPDISFSVDISEPPVARGSVPKLPDLAVEVKSADDTYAQMRHKATYYIANGSRLVWLVYLEKRLVEVYRPGRDSEILNEEDVLVGDEVLPSFSLPVCEVFMPLKS